METARTVLTASLLDSRAVAALLVGDIMQATANISPGRLSNGRRDGSGGGALVMSFFGASFCTWASVLLAGWSSPLLALGALVFLVLATVAALKIRRAAPGAYSPSPGAARIMSLSSAAKGVAIPIVALTLANTGQRLLHL